MKALSIRQPWAYLIIEGYKNIENRTWRTRYFGDLLIHASNKEDYEAYEWVKKKFGIVIDRTDILTGGVVGMVNIIGYVQDDWSNPWYFGPWGWELRNPVKLPFYKCPGKLGLFEIKKVR